MSERQLNNHPQGRGSDGAPTTADRPGTFQDRVRSLRLGQAAPRGGGGKLPWFLCIVLLLSTAGLGYRAFLSPASSPAPGDQAGKGALGDAPKAPGVKPGEVVLESKGYIIPRHQVQVSPKVSGMLMTLYVEEGKRVKKGDVLAEVEDVDYKADYDRAVASVDLAKRRLEELERNQERMEKLSAAELAETQALLTQYKLDYDRNRRMFQAGSTTVAQRDFETAEALYRSTERKAARLALALEQIKNGERIDQMRERRAEIAQYQADADKAKIHLEWCKVTAPISGTILSKGADVGALVNPVAFNIASRICDMADLLDLEVDMSIQERDVANIVVGQECKVMPEAYQKDLAFLKTHPDGYKGSVSRLMPLADRAKGAIPVRVRVEVPSEEEGVYLKPDMSAVVSFFKPK
jgi:multidrug resistance efflux pump